MSPYDVGITYEEMKMREETTLFFNHGKGRAKLANLSSKLVSLIR